MRAWCALCNLKICGRRAQFVLAARMQPAACELKHMHRAPREKRRGIASLCIGTLFCTRVLAPGHRQHVCRVRANCEQTPTPHTLTFLWLRCYGSIAMAVADSLWLTFCGYIAVAVLLWLRGQPRTSCRGSAPLPCNHTLTTMPCLCCNTHTHNALPATQEQGLVAETTTTRPSQKKPDALSQKPGMSRRAAGLW